MSTIQASDLSPELVITDEEYNNADAERRTMDTEARADQTFSLLERAGMYKESVQSLEDAVDPFGDRQRKNPGYPRSDARLVLPMSVQGGVSIAADGIVFTEEKQTWSFLAWTAPVDTTQIQINDASYFTGNVVLKADPSAYEQARIGFYNVMIVRTDALERNGGRFYPEANYATNYALGEYLFRSWSPSEEDSVIPPLGPGRDNDQTCGTHAWHAGGVEYVPSMDAVSTKGILRVGRQANFAMRDTGMMYLKPVGAGPPAQIGYSGNSPTRLCPLPPNSLSDAKRMQNSRTWAAKLGDYSVFTLRDAEAPYVQPEPAFQVYTNQTPQSLRTPEPAFSNALATTGLQSPLGVSINDGQAIANSYHNLDMHFCIGHGISQGATFDVTVRLFGQRVPDMSNGSVDQVLIPYADYGPCYDPLFLKAYALMVHDLPVGVPVGANPTGEWLHNMASALLDVGGELFPPVKLLRPVADAAISGIKGSPTRKSKNNAKNKRRKAAQAIRDIEDIVPDTPRQRHPKGRATRKRGRSGR